MKRLLIAPLIIPILFGCSTDEGSTLVTQHVQFVVPDNQYAVASENGINCSEIAVLSGISEVTVETYNNLGDLLAGLNVVSSSVSDENGFVDLDYLVESNGTSPSIWAIAYKDELSSVRYSSQAGQPDVGYNFLNLTNVNPDTDDCPLDIVMPLSLNPSSLSIQILNPDGRPFSGETTVEVYPSEETYLNDTEPEMWPEDLKTDLGGVIPGTGDFLFLRNTTTGLVFYDNLAPSIFWFRIRGSIDSNGTIVNYRNVATYRLDEPLSSNPNVTTSIAVTLSLVE